MQMNFDCGRTCSRLEWCRFSELFVKLGKNYVHSHVVSVNVEIKDLAALRRAAEKLGLEFREGQRTYRWYGRWVGDYKLPEGVTQDQLGKCDHALAVAGNPSAYEVGIVSQPDGTFKLMWDFWAGGYGLQEKIGQDCSKLTAGYTVAKTQLECERLGWMNEVQPDGSVLVYHPNGGTMTVSPTGEIEANEFQGTACSLATAPLAEALGQRVGEQRKSCYGQEQQTVGQG